MKKQIFLTILIAAFILTACGGGESAPPTIDPAIIAMALATINAASTQTAQAVVPTLPPPAEIPTTAPGAGSTPAAPVAGGFTPTAILPAVVTVAANYRFGPSTVYAGPGGARSGKVLEAIGRDASGQWILVREPGGKKSSWVNIIALQIQGDVNSLAIAPVQLIFTPDYPAPSNITATRNGDQVQISWGDVPLRPQVIYIDSHYFLELWLCTGGQLTYTILSTNDLTMTVTDAAGCSEASHGLLYTATREGYSQPATIPWP
jgi:hypothetical protein